MSSTRQVCLLLVLVSLFAAPTQAQIEVGRTITVNIDSARDYRGPVGKTTERVWSEEVRQPGSTYIAIHFADFDLGPEDYLVVSDGEGGQSYTMSGRGKREAGSFWARHIKGDAVRLDLYATGPRRGRGFVIDEIAAGFAPLAPVTEAVCGTDDKENAACYQASHSMEYDRSRPVARLLIQGTLLCTGWLVSDSNHLLTNQHCIASGLDAANTDYEFMAEAPDCADANCQLCWDGTIFSGAELLRANAALDYALVRIDSGDPAALYGHLEIASEPASPGDPIYIPQHPRGRAKELAIQSSESIDGDSVCRISTLSASACTGVSYYDDIGYFCDTEGGSSGSPVISRTTHQVVALHHCAACPNRGVPIPLIASEIAALIASPCATSADCDDGRFCNGAESCGDGICAGGIYPCPGQGCDETGDRCVDLCGNGICDAGENCDSCSSDCVSGIGSGTVCGNGICETGGGEDCKSCPDDCAGKTRGSPKKQFCCGIDTGCRDPRCSDGGNVCHFVPEPGAPFCCGDGTCDDGETGANCSLDCPLAQEACNDNLVCEFGESCRTCPGDCPGRLNGNPASRYCCGDGFLQSAENPVLCDGNR